MSELGQTRKYSPRAHVFRSAPNNGHRATLMLGRAAASGAKRSIAVRDRWIPVTGRCKGAFECAPTSRCAPRQFRAFQSRKRKSARDVRRKMVRGLDSAGIPFGGALSVGLANLGRFARNQKSCRAVEKAREKAKREHPPNAGQVRFA